MNERIEAIRSNLDGGRSYSSLDAHDDINVLLDHIDKLESAKDVVLFEFNNDIQWILGQMCFQCAHYARILRGSGEPIAEKAEAEQAAVIYWMLTMYQKYGKEEWREKGAAEMREMSEDLLNK